MKKLFKLPILIYQKAISPYLGQNCRFSPTCSSYALQAIDHYPIHKAIYLSIKRILKCHPFHPGGYDPVAPIKESKEDQRQSSSR